MTGEQLFQLGVAVAITLGLIAFSFVLGVWRSIKVDERSARDRIAFDEPDFATDELLLSADGRTGVAIDRTKREGVVVFALGDGLSTRRFRLGALPASAEAEMLRIPLRDFSRWCVNVVAPSGAEAAEWARRIGGDSVGSDDGVS